MQKAVFFPGCQMLNRYTRMYKLGESYIWAVFGCGLLHASLHIPWELLFIIFMDRETKFILHV